MQQVIRNEKRYPIPGFDKYVITRGGNVYSVRTGMLRKPQHGSSGYLELSLHMDNKQTRCGIHRLLALTFISLPDGVTAQELVVNHKNGVKHDNRLSNLEWVTYQQNAEHAGRTGLSPKCTPVSMVMHGTFEVTDFPSATACAIAIGVSKDIVLWRLKHEGDRIFAGFYFIKTKNKRKFFDAIPVETTIGRGSQVSVLYLLTGEVLVFDSQKHAAEYLQVSQGALSVWLRSEGRPVLPKCIQLKYTADPLPWRYVDDVYTELMAFTKNRVVVVINSFGEPAYFTSAVECCKATGLMPTGISYRLKSRGRVVFSDGNRYAYLEDTDLGPVSGVIPD